MTDRGTIRIVVLLTGLITLALICGAFVLVALGKTVPDPIWTLAGGGLGALTAMLVSLRSGLEPPAPVQVMNQPAQPVPVAEQPVA